MFDAANFATVTSLDEDGSPQASVVWARTDGNDVVFSTIRGRRRSLDFARDPRTAIAMSDPVGPYRHVEAKGTVTLAGDPGGALIREMSQKYRAEGRVGEKPQVERSIARIVPERVVYYGAASTD